eukprot:scaffold4328_cov135-Isochrysis_galbana.AAC.4
MSPMAYVVSTGGRPVQQLAIAGFVLLMLAFEGHVPRLPLLTPLLLPLPHMAHSKIEALARACACAYERRYAARAHAQKKTITNGTKDNEPQQGLEIREVDWVGVIAYLFAFRAWPWPMRLRAVLESTVL